jgi:hypothetical protein
MLAQIRTRPRAFEWRANQQRTLDWLLDFD